MKKKTKEQNHFINVFFFFILISLCAHNQSVCGITRTNERENKNETKMNAILTAETNETKSGKIK